MSNLQLVINAPQLAQYTLKLTHSSYAPCKPNMAFAHSTSYNEFMKSARNMKNLLTDLGEHKAAAGFSCLLAWVLCIFYTNVVEGFLPIQMQAVLGASNTFWTRLFFIGFPVFCSVLALGAIVAFSSRLEALINNKALIWSAATLTAASTFLLFAPLFSFGIGLICFVLGSLLTGAGSAFLWIMWGSYFTRLPQELVERIAPICVVISTLFCLLMTEIYSWLAVAIMVALPLISVALFSSEKQPDLPTPTGTSQKEFPELARTGFGIFVACLFVSLSASVGAGALDVTEEKFDFVLTIVFCIIFLLAVSLFSTLGPRRISVVSLYRWMCPALVIAFASVIVFEPDAASKIQSTLSLAVRLCFILITVMFFSNQAKKNANPVTIFSIGWVCVHLGDFCGVLFWQLSDVGVAAGYFDAKDIATLSICILVVVTMFVLSKSPQQSSYVFTESGLDRAQPSEAHSKVLTDEEPEDSRLLSIAEAHGLTKRETEVLGLLAKGRSIPYIRDELFISKDTVATHTRRIYQKMGVHNRQELLDLF